MSRGKEVREGGRRRSHFGRALSNYGDGDATTASHFKAPSAPDGAPRLQRKASRRRLHRGRVRGRLTLADVGVAQVPVGVLVEEGGALLALMPDGVVLAVVAHAAAHVARRHVHGQVEVARRGVVVALAP